MDKQLVIKNLLVSYVEAPGGGGQTMLFLHGWRSNKQVWAKVINSIEDTECRILALDLPGFGGSQAPKEPWSVGDYAGLVAEFVEKLQLSRVVVVGHSFGGRVGIKLAANFPQLVSRLVLVDSAGFADAVTKKKIYAALAKVVRPIFQPRVMQPLRRKIYQSLGAEDYVATPQLRQTFVNVVREDLAEDIARIRVPTLLVWGRHDRETPPRFGERMFAAIPNAQLVILEHAGHFSFIDQPEKFVEVLRKFIF
ncbi:MAG: alpha/beta hydrolase [Patescibacteria group bacterium]|nr:alpha/beta hydrolase [Patescibacteria group bacterium]